MNSQAVYDGQRGAAPDQRVFILTRSGFAGIQRYATVTWSGDITSTFSTLRKQITAGLGFSISGTPYWTTDTGGYTMERRLAQRARTATALDEWRELNARWFQYSTFCPILRVHGTDRPREMWNIGDETTAVYQTRAEVRPAALRAVPVHLFGRGRGHARRLHDDAAAGHGLPRRREGAGRDRSVHVRAGIPRESGHRVQGAEPRRSICRPAHRWYDFWTGQAARRRPDDHRRRAATTAAALRARGLDRAGRARISSTSARSARDE